MNLLEMEAKRYLLCQSLNLWYMKTTNYHKCWLLMPQYSIFSTRQLNQNRQKRNKYLTKSGIDFTFRAVTFPKAKKFY